MRNERVSEPYRRASAAQPHASPDGEGEAATAKRIAETEAGAAPATEETAAPAKPDGQFPSDQPGPRLSSGPLENQVISGHTLAPLAPPPHQPAWETSPGPARRLGPQQPWASPLRAALTHVPWEVGDSWGATTFTISANTAAGASYLFWWVSGFLIYFSERNNRFVRFHALQSIILTGILTILGVSAVLFAAVMQDITRATHQPVFYHLGIWVSLLLALAIAFIWLCVMIAAWTGNYLRLPVIGPYAERYAAPPIGSTGNPLL